jgi:poly(3-hydroxybutyrate) depolymerase
VVCLVTPPTWTFAGDDDIGFVQEVTRHVMAVACIDRAKVYLTGMSQGGMFASWLSARLGTMFAGFIPVSGTNPLGFFEYDSALATSSLALSAMPWRLCKCPRTVSGWVACGDGC